MNRTDRIWEIVLTIAAILAFAALLFWVFG
jgi:hypothetical protein